MKKQLALFDLIGDKCEACEKPYDRKLREHVTTWNVVVKDKEKIVRLYCPDCWTKAKQVIKEIKNDFRIYKEERGNRTE